MSRGATAAVAMMAALLLSHSAPLQAAYMLAPDADGYYLMDSAERYGPKYEYTDISSTGERLDLKDDSSVLVRFGFAFQFYGQTHFTANVSDNGFISFGSSDNSYGCDSTAADYPDCLSIPLKAGATGRQTPPFIAPWFDDLDPEAGGAVYFDVQGDEANHRAIVQWSAVHHDNHAVKFEFQAILYESTNKILFLYRQVNAATGAAVGIQGRDDAGINYAAGSVTNSLAIGFIPFKYGYIGLVDAGDALTQWERSGVPGEVVPYEITVVNGKVAEDKVVNGVMTYKPVAAEFQIELLPGSRWQVVDLPASTGEIAAGQTKTLTIKVKVPEAGSAAMADDIISLRVTDKVAEAGASSVGGSSTTTQNNQQVDGAKVDATKEIASLIRLKTLCSPAPCFQQDSDGDGVPDSSEAASSVSDASRLHSLAALSGEMLDIEVTGGALHGFTMEEAVDGPENVEFAAGVFNYRIIPNRIADSVTVRFTPATAWSDQLVLYKVGSDGKYTEIDKDVKVEEKRWKRVANSNAIELTLVDGGDLDEDGAANGVIVDPLAIGLKVAPQSNSVGFGSGGALFDELLLLALVAGIRYAGWRSRRASH